MRGLLSFDLGVFLKAGQRDQVRSLMLLCSLKVASSKERAKSYMLFCV